MAGIDKTRSFLPINIAVLTVSDSRQMQDDKSGSALANYITEAGHILVERDIVKDERKQIFKKVCAWCEDKNIDVIITTGGTGFTARDVTPDALEPIFEKRMDGFSHLFHTISREKIGTSTIQSRATAGLFKATFIFILPGSPGACDDAWNGILKYQLDSRYRPCNFVEIMPRLDKTLTTKHN